MIEDKLLHAERVRLEAVAQAIAFNAPRLVTIEVILTDARRIQDYITRGGGSTTVDNV